MNEQELREWVDQELLREQYNTLMDLMQDPEFQNQHGRQIDGILNLLESLMEDDDDHDPRGSWSNRVFLPAKDEA